MDGKPGLWRVKETVKSLTILQDAKCDARAKTPYEFVLQSKAHDFKCDTISLSL